MRLPTVERGENLGVRLKILLVRLLSGRRTPDVMRTIFHRPHLFGRPFSQAVQEHLRGPSTWSVGERELFAALVSRLNQCRF